MFVISNWSASLPVGVFNLLHLFLLFSLKSPDWDEENIFILFLHSLSNLPRFDCTKLVPHTKTLVGGWVPSTGDVRVLQRNSSYKKIQKSERRVPHLYNTIYHFNYLIFFFGSSFNVSTGDVGVLQSIRRCFRAWVV